MNMENKPIFWLEHIQVLYEKGMLNDKGKDLFIYLLKIKEWGEPIDSKEIN